jgi:hypothetical protein
VIRFPNVLRALAAAALVAAVGGCGVFQPNEEAMAIMNQRLLGKRATDVFDRYGRPLSRTEVAGNTSIYKWISDVGMTPPGVEGQDDRVCRLILVADKENRITSVEITYDAQGKSSRSRCAEIFAQP